MALNLVYSQSCYSPRLGEFFYEGRKKKKKRQKQNNKNDNTLPRLGAEETKKYR